MTGDAPRVVSCSRQTMLWLYGGGAVFPVRMRRSGGLATWKSGAWWMVHLVVGCVMNSSACARSGRTPQVAMASNIASPSSHSSLIVVRWAGCDVCALRSLPHDVSLFSEAPVSWGRLPLRGVARGFWLQRLLFSLGQWRECGTRRQWPLRGWALR